LWCYQSKRPALLPGAMIHLVVVVVLLLRQLLRLLLMLLCQG
jgi:hypothetical protein